MNFFNLGKKDYQVLNKIELDPSQLRQNYTILQSLNSKLAIAPVLKSNAYGHGIKEIGALIDPVKAPFICVDSLFEAYQLSKLNLKTQILIMGYTNPINLQVKKLPFSWAIWDLEMAQALNNSQKGAEIHLFVDTGMHREGVGLDELPKFLTELKNLKNLKIVGLMSHLASATDSKDPLFALQLKNFQQAKELVKRAGLTPKWFHLSASEAISHPDTLAAISQLSNLARVGLALYGLGRPDLDVRPVLEFKSTLAQIKSIQKGERVGYSGTYAADKNMIIGILPVGYNDGVDRRLSNKGSVLIKDHVCPIIGRVSMNITTIDLSGVKNPQIGDEVIMYSRDPKKPNSLDNSAALCLDIPYDLAVILNPTTRRVLMQGD